MTDRIFNLRGIVAADYSERTNHNRAKAAAVALEAYTATNTAQYRQESLEDRVGDLLCDLLHLVRRDGTEGEYIDGKRHNDADPTDLLDRARANFEEEEEEDVDDNLRRAAAGGARDPRNDR